MINSADLAQMKKDITLIIGDNDVSITVRRGDTTLPAQTVRLARMGGQSRRPMSGDRDLAQSEFRVAVIGETTLNIQPRDRFTYDSVLYEVETVRPNRSVSKVAEAKAVQ